MRHTGRAEIPKTGTFQCTDILAQHRNNSFRWILSMNSKKSPSYEPQKVTDSLLLQYVAHRMPIFAHVLSLVAVSCNTHFNYTWQTKKNLQNEPRNARKCRLNLKWETENSFDQIFKLLEVLQSVWWMFWDEARCQRRRGERSSTSPCFIKEQIQVARTKKKLKKHNCNSA